MIDAYIEAKRLGKRYAGKAGSDNTLRAYRFSLERAEKLLGKSLMDFTEEDGDLLLERMDEMNYANTHKASILAALRGFFEWTIGTKQFLGVHPFGGIIIPTSERKLPNVLNENQIDSFFANVRNEKHRLFFELMYYAGLRIEEARTLKRKDVQSDAIVVFGKGSKERRVPLTCEMIVKVNAFMKKNAATVYVFEGRSGALVGLTPFYKSFHDASEACGLPKEFHPHNLRHSSATHMQRATNNTALVQKFLGHKQITTTLIYVQVADEDLRKGYDQTHKKN